MRESVTEPIPSIPPIAGFIRGRRARPKPRLCEKTPDLPVGEAFVSECAPKPTPAVEAQLRADVHQRLTLTEGLNAVRVQRPFFDHLEVWPDLVYPEPRVAIEYDSIGRHGLEHVGRREASDRREDRALRAAGWEVVRLRTGSLNPLVHTTSSSRAETGLRLNSWSIRSAPSVGRSWWMRTCAEPNVQVRTTLDVSCATTRVGDCEVPPSACRADAYSRSKRAFATENSVSVS